MIGIKDSLNSAPLPIITNLAFSSAATEKGGFWSISPFTFSPLGFVEAYG